MTLISQQAVEIFQDGNSSINSRLSVATDVIDTVASLNQDGNFSLLPSDLNLTNLVISELLFLLEDTLLSGDNLTATSVLVCDKYYIDSICFHAEQKYSRTYYPPPPSKYLFEMFL